MSFSETIFLFFLALIIFGPKKLPEIARQIGKALNEFRRASNEFKAQIEQEIHNLDVENKRAEAQKQASLPESSVSSGAAAGLAPEGTASRGDGLADSSTLPNSTEAGLTATLAASDRQIAAHPIEPATEAIPGVDDSASGDPASDLPVPNPATSDSASELRTSDVSASDPVTSSTAQESHA